MRQSAEKRPLRGTVSLSLSLALALCRSLAFSLIALLAAAAVCKGAEGACGGVLKNGRCEGLSFSLSLSLCRPLSLAGLLAPLLLPSARRC